MITPSQGEPDFDTPFAICEAGIRAIRDGNTRYTAVAGIKPLRAAIGESLRRDHGLDYGIDQITVGCGAKQVVFNALFASLDPGDEDVIPTPCWVSYPDMVALAGGKPVLVACSELDGFKLRPRALEKAITPRTKWLMLIRHAIRPAQSTAEVICSRSLRCCTSVPICMCYPTTSMKSSPTTPTSQKWPQSRRISTSAH